MNYTKLNDDWNAQPNAPEVEMRVQEDSIYLEFFLNSFLFENFQEDDKGILKFINCHKYSFNTMNDEGYYLGQYRYKYTELPWGEFYKLETNWELDFPAQTSIIKPVQNKELLNHYIFFFRDNTFECVAESYEFTILKA